jgi:predicted nucleotidyltransferase
VALVVIGGVDERQMSARRQHASVPTIQPGSLTMYSDSSTSVLMVEYNRDAAAADLLLGRSRVRRRIAASLVDRPAERLHLREIQRRVGTSAGTASRELGRLVEAGIVDRRREGAQVYFSIRRDAPLYPLLRDAIRRTSGAPEVIRSRLRGLPGIRRAAVFGSYLAGDEAPGGVVDLLVEGDVDPDELRTALSDAEADLGRPIRLHRAVSALPEPGGLPDPGRAAPVELLERPWPSPATGRPRARPRPDQASLAIARQAASALSVGFGDRLRAVWLYGSRARGDHQAGSDLDLLVVLDEVGRWRAEHDVAGDAIATLSLEHGLVITRVFVAEEDWRNRATPLLRAAAADAIAVL